MVKKVSKLVFVFTLVSALLFQGVIGSNKAAATEGEEPTIRIGVIPSVESLTVGGVGTFDVIDKKTGETLVSGENEQLTAEISGESIVKTNYRLQVSFTTSNAAVQDWLTRAEGFGYSTYVEPYNNGWRLLIGEFPSDASFAVRTAFKNEIVSKGLGASDAYWRLITLVEGESVIKITQGQTVVTTPNAIQVISEDLVKINDRRYRGIAEVGFNSSGTLAGINELPMEEYLYGVVPRELPPVPYGEIEAQKSQAVAARTYAFAGLGKRSKDGYDLLPTTSDQVYGGFEDEHPISNQAVDETRGVVATYEGKLITAVFNSTSGGFSANNEDIWSSDAVPYLRGVPDAQRGKSFEHVPSLEVFKNSSNSNSLRAMKNGDFESDWSKYHRWNFEWTAEEISDVLSTSFNKEVGKVYEINVIERSSSGRVLEIEFVTESGNLYAYKDSIRSYLKYINSSGNQASLLSTLFHIEPVKNKQTDEIGFKVYGGGWGHGVGLSQTGAVGMAEKGASFEKILKHYYQGIDLEDRY
ncbi:SpoIID/LytB domain-containing protein [Fredinandcohnia sp. 179-A 10B2 NHS]|uniref:SpoIID/LytB domain-containing protein n=1 Tax=Fredinandcohnia sp. 179-A 10B2 NHS TaxID=3235176 RepID=UPI00399F48EB